MQNKSNKETRKKRIKNDISKYGNAILKSEEMRKAFAQTHHHKTTVGEHTLNVAYYSTKICYALNKVHINTNIQAVIIGSLCHDLGILGRDKKYFSNKECKRQHPIDSVLVARRLVNDLPDKTEDIIKRHMWPIGGSKTPNSIEGIIVSVADKYAAIKDVM